MQVAREQLDLAIAYQRILADAMPVLVMMADPDGTVNYFNDAWFRFTGQPRFDRDSDNNWMAYMHPRDAARVAQDWSQAVAQRKDVVDMEYRLRESSTGLYRWVKARATAVRDEDGELVQWIGTAMDIDDHRRTNTALVEIAHAYQSASLPYLERSLGGLRFSVGYRASARHLTACGDWYDAFPLGDGRIAVCIGDVRGHGLQAATLMAQYRQSVRAIALRVARVQSGGPNAVLSGVEEAIELEHPRASATVFFGIISADRQSIEWGNAGHPPPLVLRKDGHTDWIAGNEPPLGWRFGVERTCGTTNLADAAALVLYTDGLVEASRNINDGMSRLEQTIRNVDGSNDLAMHILETWMPPPTEDDVAILAIEFSSP